MGKSQATQNEEADKQQNQETQEVASTEEEEASVGDPAPAVVDPFLDRKAQRLAAVQLQVDGPKREPVTSDVTEEEKEE